MFITDPWFYAAAIPAVIVSGISKGGFGGGLGILSVPIMALVISPVQAAAILLPLLCLMDLFGLWAYHRKWDTTNLRTLFPGSLAGIVIGALLFRYLTPEFIKLLLGSIAMLFTIDYWTWDWRSRNKLSGKPSFFWGSIAGIVAGLTSFIANAGATPVSMYLLPQRMHRTSYVATTVMLFALINYVKLIPYGWLGLLHITNLATALLLIPAAALGMLCGIWLHKQVADAVFYRICYLFLFVVGLKLIYDAI